METVPNNHFVGLSRVDLREPPQATGNDALELPAGGVLLGGLEPLVGNGLEGSSATVASAMTRSVPGSGSSCRHRSRYASRRAGRSLSGEASCRVTRSTNG